MGVVPVTVPLTIILCCQNSNHTKMLLITSTPWELNQVNLFLFLFTTTQISSWVCLTGSWDICPVLSLPNIVHLATPTNLFTSQKRPNLCLYHPPIDEFPYTSLIILTPFSTTSEPFCCCMKDIKSSLIQSFPRSMDYLVKEIFVDEDTLDQL